MHELVIGNKVMTSLPGFVCHLEGGGRDANVNRMAIVEAQRVSEGHQLSERGLPIVFMKGTAIDCRSAVCE